MSSRGRKSARRRKGPPPVEAPTSMAAHDLKNLATRLSALGQNLSDSFEDPLFKPIALDVLKDTVGRLQRLAVDLREHEGRVSVKLRVDVNRLLEEALFDVRPGVGSKCEIFLDAEELPPIWGDAFLLRRAFACAIENSLQAMNSARGTLMLSTRTHRRKGAARIRVEIADTGPGMDIDFLREKLSRPFSSTKEDGMGLGVYTMGQVASLHGGTVRISSEPGVGTRVRFYLPAAEK